MRRTTALFTLLLVVVGTTFPNESLAFQGIAKTTVLTGQTPPPKSRIEPPRSELSMMDLSFFTDVLLPDVRVLRYIQLMCTDPENTPILLSALSAFLIVAGIGSTTPQDATGMQSSSSSTHLGYASSTKGATTTTTFQATMEPPPTTTADPYQYQPQRSFRGRNARGSVSVTNAPAAAKLPAMQDRYQPLSYGPMNHRSGGTSPLKTILTARTVEKPGVAEPQQSPSKPTRDLSHSFDGPSVNQKAFDWTKDPRTGRASLSTPLPVVVNTPPPKRFSASPRNNPSNTFDGPWANQNAFDWAQAGERLAPVQRWNERAAPTLYAPTISSSSLSDRSYLESLVGGVQTKPIIQQSSYAPRSVMAVPNVLGNSYLEAMGMVSNRGADMRSPPATTTAQPQDSGSVLATMSSRAKRKQSSSYAPTQASVGTKATGNALGSSYFAVMGRSAPTTVYYQYSPTELAARAGLHSAVATSSDKYSSDSPSSSPAQGSYLDTVGGGTSPRKELSYAPTKPSVMTKPMGNAMGSTYFASMGAIIPPSFSYLLSDEPEPPTAGAMKPYLSTLTKEDSSTTRRSSYAPTKPGVGKMSSTTVGSSYLQMMGSTVNKSPWSADPSVPPRRSMQHTASPSLDGTRHSSETVATEVVSYLDVLSGGKQSSLPVKRSFAPTQPSVSNKSGTTIGSSYLSSLGR